jgi:hypothetical protein
MTSVLHTIANNYARRERWGRLLIPAASVHTKFCEAMSIVSHWYLHDHVIPNLLIQTLTKDRSSEMVEVVCLAIVWMMLTYESR